MPHPKQIKHIKVRFATDGAASSFTHDMFIPFKPDSMILKYSYFYAGGGVNTFFLHSDNILPNSDLLLCPLVDDGSVNVLDLEFPLLNEIRGTYRFQLRDPAGDLVTPAAGNIVLHLIFVKY